MNLRVAAVMGVLMMSSVLAQQPPSRVRGTITAIDGNTLSVKSREGQDLQIELAPNATFAYVKKMSLADVTPGTPLGTSAVKRADGKLVARELHLFSRDRPVPNEGTRPTDLEPEATMTNAMVTAVVEASHGNELTLTYKGGHEILVVGPDIPIVMPVDADRSLLVPNTYALIQVTPAPGGKLVATRLQLTKDGVRPPQ